MFTKIEPLKMIWNLWTISCCRAFELWKYGLCYEDDVKIPEGIQERVMVGPGRMGSINDMINPDEEVLTVKVH